MLIVVAILLLLIVPLLMLLLHLTRWKHVSQWLIAVIAMIIVWLILLANQQDLPQSITYLTWEPKTLFPVSPTLLVDEISWTFSLSLAALGLALVLTSVARNEQASMSSETPFTNNLEQTISTGIAASWQTWVSSLLIIGVGLVAVQSGNLPTILLAWAILDVLVLFLLLTQVHDNQTRQRAIFSFAVQAVGISVLVLAEIQAWYVDGILSLASISPRTAVFLLLASGIRLGLLTLRIPFLQEAPLRRGLGTILQLVPAAASLSLLVRAAAVGLGNPVRSYLLILIAFAAILGAGLWAAAQDELSGRPFWILGTAALASAAAVLGQPMACLSWGIASLLAGGLLSLFSLRHPRLRIIAIIGFLSLSGLPFTPNWNGVMLSSIKFTYTPTWISIIFIICFIVAHALLLAGYLRHSLRMTSIAGEQARDPQVERWIWLIYPLGLLTLPVTHFLIGYWIMPDYRAIPIAAFFSSIAASAIGFGIWFVFLHVTSSQILKSILLSREVPSTFLSLSWLYQPILFVFRLLQRLSAMVHSLLEGDGGILWAIVLFFFILMFFQR